MVRNGHFLADLMDRAWLFGQEMRRCKRRDIQDGHQSSALLRACSGVRIRSFRGGAFALNWIALISSWGLKASGRPRASLALGLRAQTTFPGRWRSDYLRKISTVRKRSPCSRRRAGAHGVRADRGVNAASCDGQRSGALRLRFSADGVESLRRASVLSDTARPFSVMQHPRFARQIRACEKCQGSACAKPVVWCVWPNPGRWSPGPSWYA